MTIMIEQHEAKELGATVISGCVTLIVGTLVTRKVVDLVIKKAVKKKKEDES